MEVLKDKYTITELSEVLNVTTHALRYYEKEFNLNIPKDSRGRRFYPTEYANIMYQIKNMRDEGLEIKAIKKILEDQILPVDTPSVMLDDGTTSVISVYNENKNDDLRLFFYEFKDEISQNIEKEAQTTRELVSRELNKTKLELGACVENSSRKLELKLDRHFQEVDRALGLWRDRNKGNAIRRFFNGIKK